MSGHNKAMSEQLSIREGVGYNKLFPLGYRLEEGLSWSSEREPSTRSLVNEEEDFDGNEVE